MKLKCGMWQVTSDKQNSAARPAPSCCVSRVTRHPEQAVALIITVILLAVVTFLAITFLAVSQRERGAVTATTDTATAKLAADDALAAAEAQIMANTLAATNPYNFGLMVSTNYINPLGFAKNSASPTNVNYDYYTTGPGPLSLGDFLQNLANLYYSPRPPVYATNLTYHYNELQFYLDLNRNGWDEPNGEQPEIAANGQYIHQDGTISPDNVNVLTNFQVGDPEWIGVLQHPDQPYGPNNPFVARYAFVAVPVGNALDLNAIYNEAATREVNTISGGPDGYLRHQGVGSWEINLAAFLADLNTNAWGQVIGTPANGMNKFYYYQYSTSPDQNYGSAFDDARALLNYRYDGDYSTLRPVAGPDGLFTTIGAFLPFQDSIDYYSDMPVGLQNVSLPWAGADNTNHFFDLQELFDPSHSSRGFTNRLGLADHNISTYNRDTYYRLLSQLGVDSVPTQKQINLNYANAYATFDNGVPTKITYYPEGQTNFVPWAPLQFFTIAADRMLRTYSREWLEESASNYVATYGMTTNIGTLIDPTNVPVPFGIADIPVYINGTNRYTPAIQRVLQLAANIYDATTNNIGVNGNTRDFPSVFRPIFLVTNDPASGYRDVYIAGYEPVEYNGEIGAVSGANDSQLDLPVDVTSLSPGSSAPGAWEIYTNVNVYGVPWIVGAKKGFPNFNEFAMESVFQLTRKLQVRRESTNSPPSTYQYDQMFNLSISNQFGVEYWNSYTNNYLQSVAIFVTNIMTGVLSNDEGFSTTLSCPVGGRQYISGTAYNNNGWPGYNPLSSGQPLYLTPDSFQIPMQTNAAIVTNSTYRFNGGVPYLTTNVSLPYEQNVVDPVTGQRYPQPHWMLTTTNNLQAFILDTSPGGPPYHVLDYVQLSGPNSARDLTSEVITNYDSPIVSVNASGDELWNTNFQAGVPIGLLSQIGVALNNYTPGANSGAWDLNNHDTRNSIDAFRAFYYLSPIWNYTGGRGAIAAARMTNAIASPYQPTATVVQHIDWQANDPLVHYLASDLNWPRSIQYDRTFVDLASPTNDAANLGKLNQRYTPWGGYPLVSPTVTAAEDENAYNLSIKDPLVWRSDDWDFPTYKLPTVGWLGRVHRGTPWQTVYLKSPDILREVQVSGGIQTNDIGPVTWAKWTGDTLLTSRINGQYFDAINSAPVQDRLLFDLFTTAPNDNATRGQLSVNVGANDPNNLQAGLAAWSALFSGVQVPSNSAALLVPQHNGSVPFTTLLINPAGPAGIDSPVGQIVKSINQARADSFNTAKITFVNGTGTATNEIPAAFRNVNGLGGAFEHVGDILSAPQLSDESPFLNWNNATELQYGISDEMYEWLPQQVLSLLRVSGTAESPMRYVIYSYGQALKPAPNGIYTGGQTINIGGGQTISAFGMVTNYQVVAESATRAVVNFGSVVTNVVVTNADNIWISLPVVTNNTAQIEQFNVLPPY